MARAILLVLDSVGIGAAPDAAAYGDAGADTLGHIAEACAAGRGDRAGLRAGPLRCRTSTRWASAPPPRPRPVAFRPASRTVRAAGSGWGFGTEVSAGKDTPSGHWESPARPCPIAWGYFPASDPCLPAGARRGPRAPRPAFPASWATGTRRAPLIIDDLGEEHR